MRNAYGNAWAEFYDIEFTLGMEKYYADAKMIFEYEAFFDEFGKWEIEDYKLDSIYEVTIYSEDGNEIKPDKELVDAMYKEVWNSSKHNDKIEQAIMDDIEFP